MERQMNNALTATLAAPEEAWSGSRMINVLNPDPEDLILSEIATGLAREPRYGGSATFVVWSVAQHCLLCDHFAEQDGVSSRDIRLALLLHDAPEYMLRDLISPVKQYCPDYRRIEDTWTRAVATRFGLPPQMPGIVKHYDQLACSSEKTALISPGAGIWPGLPAPRAIPGALLALTTGQARVAFEEAVGKFLAVP